MVLSCCSLTTAVNISTQTQSDRARLQEMIHYVVQGHDLQFENSASCGHERRTLTLHLISERGSRVTALLNSDWLLFSFLKQQRSDTWGQVGQVLHVCSKLGQIVEQKEPVLLGLLLNFAAADETLAVIDQ